MADRIVINAKTQRPSVCNAAEKLLVHEQVAATYIPRIAKKLIDAGVELRGDERARELAAGLPISQPAEQEWYEEYLRLCMAIAVVGSADDAIAHINKYSTKHSDSIVTADEANARKFLRGVDSAAVYWNASTRFTDGGEFGFGAEMGISTQKLHCRGPFALPELTSSKYEIIGERGRCGNHRICVHAKPELASRRSDDRRSRLRQCHAGRQSAYQSIEQSDFLIRQTFHC
jgi:glutamate-5-semialdehyde dehydrogenase